MFGTNLECGIRSVKVKVQDIDGRELRRCRVVLAHEFTDDIAATLGPDAVNIKDALQSRAAEKATLPIDGIAAIGDFVCMGNAVRIGRMIGVKATALAAKKDDDGPTIQMELEFVWDEAAWVFLGRHCNSVASVVLTKRQLALAVGDDSN